MLLKALFVFVALVIIDAAWTLYIMAASKHQAVQASTWSALIVALSGFAAIEYTREPLLLGAAVLGAFVGTYATVLHQRKRT